MLSEAGFTFSGSLLWMREPAFWWQPGGGALLSPLAAVYGAVAALRMQSPGQRVGVPVICLGNLTVGGAGKTPAALAVGRAPPRRARTARSF